MLLFDVRCRVRESIHVTDPSGADVTIAAGSYHLQGFDHVVRGAGGVAVQLGTELRFVSGEDHGHPYRISPENLAHFMALSEIEIHS